jgi:hypothetical protein
MNCYCISEFEKEFLSFTSFVPSAFADSNR